MANVKEQVEYYVSRLSGDEEEDAWHRLVEVGPAALRHVMAAFDATSEGSVQVALIRVVAEYRSTDAVPFLSTLLEHSKPGFWRSALDALVTVGGRPAIEALAGARAAAPPTRREWIDEAIEQAVAWLLDGAEGGDAAAQLDLGIVYAEGLGVREDYLRAASWLRKAAEQGHAEAQYYLARCPTTMKPLSGSERLRNRGYVPAQFALAWRYEGAGGVTPDAGQAVAWLRRAAEQGHTDAQRLLGGHYASGDGVEQDHVEAVRWIRMAAELGNEAAEFELGDMYAAGRGVPRDDDQAAVWRCRAAVHGRDFVQYRRAARYADASRRSARRWTEPCLLN